MFTVRAMFLQAKIYFTILMSFCVTIGIPAENIRIGKEQGWDNVVLFENTKLTSFAGVEHLVLDDSVAVITESTELFIDFDSHIQDNVGKYSVQNSNTHVQTEKVRFGSGAARFDGSASLIITPISPHSMFGQDMQVKSFSIGVWLYPTQLIEGAKLLQWQGVLVQNDTPVLQQFTLELINQRLQWTGSHVVIHPQDEKPAEDFSLSALSPLVPMQWQHHEFRYDAVTGKLIYFIDGIPEAIHYLYLHNSEKSVLGYIFLGTPASTGITVGTRYYGFMDELYISTDIGQSFRRKRYDGKDGKAYTKPLIMNGRLKHVECT